MDKLSLMLVIYIHKKGGVGSNYKSPQLIDSSVYLRDKLRKL